MKGANVDGLGGGNNSRITCAHPFRPLAFEVKECPGAGKFFPKTLRKVAMLGNVGERKEKARKRKQQARKGQKRKKKDMSGYVRKGRK